MENYYHFNLVAEIAGSIASGYERTNFWSPESDRETARRCVSLARAIIAETERTEPKGATDAIPVR